MDLAQRDVQRGLHYVCNRIDGFLGARHVQRLGTQCRETIDLLGALVCVGCLALHSIEQVSRNGARRQERQQHQPIQRVRERERVVRRQKKKIEGEKAEHRQAETEPKAMASAGEKDHQQECHRHVSLVQHRPGPPEHGRRQQRRGQPTQGRGERCTENVPSVEPATQ